MGQNLEIKYDMEEMFIGIKEAVKEELKPVIAEEIKDEIKADVTKQVTDKLKELVPIKIDDWISEMLKDIYENTTIKIGGGWDKEPEVFTIKEYVLNEIKGSLSDGKVKIKTRDRYGDYKVREVSFPEWITDECVSPEIKEYMDNQATKTKKEINKKLKEVFDESTRSMLSENVMSILMANDTYKKIQSNITSIATNK